MNANAGPVLSSSVQEAETQSISKRMSQVTNLVFPNKIMCVNDSCPHTEITKSLTATKFQQYHLKGQILKIFSYKQGTEHQM
jgi:hypothetical protein